MSIVLNSQSLQSMAGTSKLPTKSGLQSSLSFEQWLRFVWESLPAAVLKTKTEQMFKFPSGTDIAIVILSNAWEKNIFIQFRSLKSTMRSKGPPKIFRRKLCFYSPFSRTQTISDLSLPAGISSKVHLPFLILCNHRKFRSCKNGEWRNVFLFSHRKSLTLCLLGPTD